MKRDFLHITDFSTSEIHQLLQATADLKMRFYKRDLPRPFAMRTLAMIFAKPSLRTRLSFETGFAQLGGRAIYLSPTDIEVGKREPVKDLARVIGRDNDMIMARLFEHAHIIELAEYSPVPVINGLTDYNHPCQILSDIFTIKESLGRAEDLKIAYVGDGNNLVHSFLRLSMRLSFHFVCACPEGYDPDETTLSEAVSAGKSTVEIFRDPAAAVKDADVVCTDVWASMGQKHELETREKHFANYRVTPELMTKAGKQAIFMHCLPAERGREVTDAVMESPASVVFTQAENRMHLQNALMIRLMESR